MNPIELKELIEKETNLKVSMKIQSTSSSMRGYVTYKPRKVKGEWIDFDFKYCREFLNRFDQPEPHTTFASISSINYYFGNIAYNYVKTKSKSISKPKSIKIGNVIIPPNKQNENFFIGWTLDLGKKKGVKGSGGWGYVPNINYLLVELTQENLNRYTSGGDNIILGDGKRKLISDIK